MAQNLLFSMVADAADTVPVGNASNMSASGSPTFVNEVANGLQAYRLTTGTTGHYTLPVAVSLNASADRAVYIALKFRASAAVGSTQRLFGISSSSSDLTLGSSVGINAAGLLCPSGGGSLLCSQALSYNDGTWYTVLYKVEFRAASTQDRGRMWYEPDGSAADAPNVSSSAAQRPDGTAAHVFLSAASAVTLHYRAALVLEATDLASELSDAQARAMANDLEGYIAGLSGGGPTYTLTLDPATFTLTGQTVDLTYTPNVPALTFSSTHALRLKGSGTLLASRSDLKIDVIETGTAPRAVVVSLDGHTTNASGIPAAIADAALTEGTTYTVVGRIAATVEGQVQPGFRFDMVAS